MCWCIGSLLSPKIGVIPQTECKSSASLRLSLIQLCGVYVNTQAAYNRFRCEITHKGCGHKLKPRLIIWGGSHLSAVGAVV